MFARSASFLPSLPSPRPGSASARGVSADRARASYRVCRPLCSRRLLRTESAPGALSVWVPGRGPCGTDRDPTLGQKRTLRSPPANSGRESERCRGGPPRREAVPRQAAPPQKPGGHRGPRAGAVLSQGCLHSLPGARSGLSEPLLLITELPARGARRQSWAGPRRCYL